MRDSIVTSPPSTPERAGATPPRAIIAHDFAETYGGAERTIAILAEMYPDAPFWTILGRQAVAERMGVADRFHSLLPARERLFRSYRRLAPIYPSLVRLRPLPDSDVLLTSSFAFAHGFSTRNRAPQVCYCYSPPRFAWSMREDYAEHYASAGVSRVGYGAFAAWMRFADRRAATRVTRFVAESHYVADQIRRFYGRDADVVHPPVDCGTFRPPPEPGHGDYYLFCSRLVEPYKRASTAIDAFRSLPDRLVIANNGPAYRELRERAPANVEFVGKVPQDELVSLMQRCRAVIFPSKDDFGLVPLEAMACGRPAIAYGAGGALETVVPGVTGELFAEQTPESLREAVRDFDPAAYDPAAVRRHAESFDVPRFRDAMRGIIEEVASST